jgi:hypothetical protein
MRPICHVTLISLLVTLFYFMGLHLVRLYTKDMGVPSSQQNVQWFYLISLPCMFRSFDHLQVGIHNTDPLFLDHLSYLLTYIVLGEV